MDEGYIKFTNERCDGAVPQTTQLGELNSTRTALFDLKLIGQYPDGVGYGNLSLRVSKDTFVITASATGGNRELQHHQYCLVESFSPERNWVLSRGPMKASSESMTHGAIYSANPTVNYVIHVHSGALFEDLCQQHWLETPADTPYGTPAMAEAVSRLVRAQSSLPVLFVMAGHAEGIVVYGADLASTQKLLLDNYYRTERT